MEKIHPMHHSTSWKLKFTSIIIPDKQNAINDIAQDDPDLQVFTNGSGLDGSIGASTILYRYKRHKASLRYNLGPISHYTIDETPKSVHTKNGYFTTFTATCIIWPITSWHPHSKFNSDTSKIVQFRQELTELLQNYRFSNFGSISAPFNIQFCLIFSICIHTNFSCMILFYNLSVALSSQFLIIHSYSNFNFTTIALFLVI